MGNVRLARDFYSMGLSRVTSSDTNYMVYRISPDSYAIIY